MALDPSVTINFSINLEKPNNQVVGQSNLYVYSEGSSGTQTPIFSQSVQANSWSSGNPNTYSTSGSFTLSASNFNASGGAVFAVFKSFSGAESQSCSYSVTKTNSPTFTLSPTTLSIPCGSTATRTFTVTNVYSSPGTLSYKWTVGSSWKYNGSPAPSTFTTTTNSIALVPNTYPLANISVTPILDGISKPTKTCTVSLEAIADNATLTGGTIICSSGTYSVSGLPAGQSVSWSLSNGSVASLSSTSGTQTVLTKTGGGPATVTATITNSCGQSYQKNKSIYVGAPLAFNVTRASTEDEFCDIKYHYVRFIIPNKNSLLSYTFNAFPIPGMQSGWYGNGWIQFMIPKTYTGYLDFTVTASNSCGSTNKYVDAYVYSCNSQNLSGEGVTPSTFKIYPNPSSDTVQIDLENMEGPSTETAEITGELYNIQGNLVTTFQIIDYRATLDVSQLKKGMYIIKISRNGKAETHQLIVK